MKKIIIGVLLFSICIFICGCGDVSSVKILQCESDIYTEAEISSAIKVTKDYFKKNFDGCSLKELGYAGDETTKGHEEWAWRHNADEVIVLVSSFDVGKSGGDGSLNPDSTYTNWKWILVRSGGSAWRHVDHGY